MNIGKRGLINETGGAILWVIILVVLIFVATQAWGKISTSNEENQAKGTLERFGNFLLDLNDGQAASFIVYNPKGFYFVPLESKVCICKDTGCENEKSWCKTIDKPIEYSGNPIAINIGTFIVTKTSDKYLFNADIIEDTKEEEVQVTANCSGELVFIGGGYQLRESAAAIFNKATEIAKSKGVNLTVTSAYRTMADQEAKWIKYKKDPTRVCNPIYENSNPPIFCPHRTGCAVDVCFGDLCDKNTVNINNAETQLLQDIMVEAGFVRYSYEYWHFEYGTSRWQTCKSQGTAVC